MIRLTAFGTPRSDRHESRTSCAAVGNLSIDLPAAERERTFLSLTTRPAHFQILQQGWHPAYILAVAERETIPVRWKAFRTAPGKSAANR